MVYSPGTQERDYQKQNMSLQAHGAAIETNTANIAISAASIAAMQAAWTAYTPTVTASSGAFTTVSATGRFLAIGKTVFVKVAINITTVGTASGIVQATLPNTSVGGYNLSGNAGAGFQLTANTVGNQLFLTKYDGTSAISAGATLFGSGVYEST